MKKMNSKEITEVKLDEGALPNVRPINSFELRRKQLDAMRPGLKAQTVGERNRYFSTLMERLAHARLCMDRVFMRNAIRQIQLCVEEHQQAMQLTDEEKTKWQRIASEALQDTNWVHVPQHCVALLNFWQSYWTAKW